MTKLPVRFFLVGALLLGPVAYAQTPDHAYNLTNSLNDLVGNINLVGDGGTLVSGVGYEFGSDHGVSLSGVFTGGNASVYTIVFDETLSTIASDRGNGYIKMVDFDNRAADAGYYSHGGDAALYSSAQALTPVYTANQVFQTVLTRDAAGTFDAYVDGVLQFSVDDATDQFAVFAGTDGIARFMEDDTVTGDETADGTLTYIATYDEALTATEVAGITEVTSPTTSTPEPASFALLATGLVGVFGVARRRKKA